MAAGLYAMVALLLLGAALLFAIRLPNSAAATAAAAVPAVRDAR
jgi:hypothetical protein